MTVPTGPTEVHPAVAARGRRRVRARIAAVLWMVMLGAVALLQIIAISAVRSLDFYRWLTTSTEQLFRAGAYPGWLLELAGRSGTLVLSLLGLFAFIIVVAVVAAAISPTAIVRRIIAPIVAIGAVALLWVGVQSVARAYIVLQVEPLAFGALLLGLGLAVAVLSAWVGLGSRAGGLGAVVLAAFLKLLPPLIGLGAVTLGSRDSFLDGPSAAVFGLHWLQSAVVVIATIVAGVILLRTATYRRG